MTSTSDLQPIHASVQYPVELFLRFAGLGRAALREARRKGLRVTYIHGRCFILGRDWLEYCSREGKGTKDE